MSSRARVSAVCANSARVRARSPSRDFAVRQGERSQHVVARAHHDELSLRFEERLEAFPIVAQHRGAARSGLEQAPRGTIAVFSHRLACQVQGEPRALKELGVLARPGVLQVGAGDGDIRQQHLGLLAAYVRRRIGELSGKQA